MTLTTRYRGCAAVVALLFGTTAPGFAQEGSKISNYAQAIVQAEADLDAGRLAEARKKLDATEAAARGFEYQYLLARAAAGASNGDRVLTLAKPKVNTRYAVLNEVDRRVAFICQDGSLQVYDLKNPTAAPKAVAHTGGAVWSGAFSHDGKTFAAGYEDGEVVLWDAATWTPRHVVKVGEKSPVREIAVAPNGSMFVAEGAKALELWSIASGKAAKVADVGPRYNFGEGLAFSPKGEMVATGGMFDIVVHDANTGAQTKSMRHASYTMGLAFSPDGKRIASAPRGNVNRFLAVFEIGADKPLFNAGPFPGYITGHDFMPDGKRVVTTSQETLVRVFDAATGDVLLTVKRPEVGVKPAATRDGRLLGWSEPGGFRYIDLDEKVGVE